MTKWNLCMIGSTYENQSKKHTILDYLSFYDKIKCIYKNSTANIILNSQRLRSFPRYNRNKTRMFILTTSTQHCIENISQRNMARKRNTSYPDGKGRSKIIFIPRGHDKKYRKLLKNPWKTIRYNKRD